MNCVLLGNGALIPTFKERSIPAPHPISECSKPTHPLSIHGKQQGAVESESFLFRRLWRVAQATYPLTANLTQLYSPDVERRA
jgi:hypothetical protein